MLAAGVGVGDWLAVGLVTDSALALDLVCSRIRNVSGVRDLEDTTLRVVELERSRDCRRRYFWLSLLRCDVAIGGEHDETAIRADVAR